MNDASQTHGAPTDQSLHRRSLIAGVILAVSFFAAAAIRLYNINAAKLYFNPTRQYYSFCIAKGFYFQSADSVPQWAKRIAAINKEALDDKEPPVTEYLVALIWRFGGGQNHWAPSLVCSVFWLIGGVFVFLIAKKYTTVVAAAIATAFYLLSPFGIVMSRSFQPESLMVLGFLAGIYTIFVYYQQESIKRLVIASVVCALAILIKVNIVLPLWCAFVAGSICKKGFHKTIFSLHHYLFVLIGICPPFIYYLYRTLTAEIMQLAAKVIFVPQLLWDSFFWTGWLDKLGSVVGFIPILAAGFGILLVRDRLTRNLLIGLVGGYFVYAAIFTYTTPTQNYYHIQVLPITALALAPAIAFFLNQLLQKDSPLHRPAIIIGLLLLIAILGLLASIKTSVFRSESRFLKLSLASAYKCFGIRPDYLSQFSADYPEFIERAQKIGYAVNHSDKTITLGLTVPLWYYGQYAGYRWPYHRLWSVDEPYAGIGTGAKWKEYRGLTAEELFDRHFSGFSPEYFVVTSLGDFDKQKTLQELLYGKFKLLVKEEKYLIFDLTKPKQ